MERDILKLSTLANGERIGTALFSEIEIEKNSRDLEEASSKRLLNSLAPSFCEYSLDNVDSLPDDDYPMNLFQNIYYAAHLVAEGEPIPVCKAKPLLRYRGDEVDSL